MLASVLASVSASAAASVVATVLASVVASGHSVVIVIQTYAVVEGIFGAHTTTYNYIQIVHTYIQAHTYTGEYIYI